MQEQQVRQEVAPEERVAEGFDLDKLNTAQ
jgi:hypothetical protein